MNGKTNLFLIFVCFFLTVSLTVDLVAELGLLSYLGSAFLAALTFLFLPVRLFIFGFVRIRQKLNGRKVKTVE